MIKQYTTIIKKTKQDKDLQSKRWRPREMWRQVRNRKGQDIQNIKQRERRLASSPQISKRTLGQFQGELWDCFVKRTDGDLWMWDKKEKFRI